MRRGQAGTEGHTSINGQDEGPVKWGIVECVSGVAAVVVDVHLWVGR